MTAVSMFSLSPPSYADDPSAYVVISALATRSGSEGLEAFLPDRARVFTHTEGDGDKDFFDLWRRDEADEGQLRDLTPRLPLTAHWNETDFSMEAVLPSPTLLGKKKIYVRDWVVQAIYRYRFLLGEYPLRDYPASSC